MAEYEPRVETFQLGQQAPSHMAAMTMTIAETNPSFGSSSHPEPFCCCYMQVSIPEIENGPITLFTGPGSNRK